MEDVVVGDVVVGDVVVWDVVVWGWASSGGASKSHTKKQTKSARIKPMVRDIFTMSLLFNPSIIQLF